MVRRILVVAPSLWLARFRGGEGFKRGTAKGVSSWADRIRPGRNELQVVESWRTAVCFGMFGRVLTIMSARG